MSNETPSQQTDAPHSDRPMTTERLQRLLDAYGGTPAGWPEDVRATALALIAVSPEARAMREAASGLDSMLDNMAPPAPSADLSARLERAGPRQLEARPDARREPLIGGLLRSLAGFVSAGRQFSRFAPAALGLAGVMLVALSLFAVYRGMDDGEAGPSRVVVASAAPAQDFLADVPLVDVAVDSGSDADETEGAADDPWVALLPDDGSEEAIRLSYLPEAELPLE